MKKVKMFFNRCYPGKFHGGGVIFFVDHTQQHGLICSMVDLSAAQAWSNVTNALIGRKTQSVWNGRGNTQAIIDQKEHVSSAAKLCYDWTNPDTGTGVYSDWYLMSIGEARHLSNNIYQIQKALETDRNTATIPISNGIYWTSTEESDTTAWGCGLVNDDCAQLDFKSEPGIDLTENLSGIQPGSDDALKLGCGLIEEWDKASGIIVSTTRHPINIKSEPLYVRAIRAF